MVPLLRSRQQQVAGAFTFVSLLAVGFLPLFGGPGYEQSLASGLLVPSVVAIATSAELSQGSPPAPLDAVYRGIASGLALSGVAFATALVQALRVGLCDLTSGALGFALTALVGSVLGGVWGAVVAEVARRKRRRRLWLVSLSLGLPLGSALVSVARFYTSPMIFAFDPFVGYFSGTLYDTVIDAGAALVTYRVGSLATIGAVLFVASLLERGERGERGKRGERGEDIALRFVPLWGPGRSPGVRARAAFAMAFTAVSLLITANGPTLGHWQTSSTIAEDLGGAMSGERCDVVYPESLLPEQGQLLVKDCDEQLRAVEETLGGRGPDRIRAFFFRDSSEKKRLMGAADTLIAKPWRHEVYVQLSTYPHPVLGHELAHVVAGSFGRGPFRIAGSMGGVWPDPGLIEGIAVAASPDDDELSGREWAHAMLEMGSVPPLRTFFSIGFLNVSAQKSYTLAGAFVRYILDTYGSKAVRDWYGGASLEALTGKGWGELDQDFRTYASATRLSPEAESFARARFERAAVFGRKCPHVVDALRRKADLCRDSHEAVRATEDYDDVLRRDPHDWGAIYGLGIVNVRYGNVALGEESLTRLTRDPVTPRTWRDRARDALADAALLRGEDARAKAEFLDLAARSLEEDFARTEEVKVAAMSDPLGRATIVPLLLGAPRRPADSIVGAERLGEWVETGSPLAEYMAGRSFVGREWYEAAIPHLDRAIEKRAELTVRVAREAIRLRAVVACAMGDGASVRALLPRVTGDDGPFSGSGRRTGTLRLLSRCSVAAVPTLAP
jgi:hypothetical protein